MTNKILEQAKKIRERTDRDLAAMRTRASSSDGKVSAEMNGHRQLLALRIDGGVLDPAAGSALEARVLEAVNRVTHEMTERLYERIGKSATDLPRLFS